jgi:hypothetical protein
MITKIDTSGFSFCLYVDPGESLSAIMEIAAAAGAPAHVRSGRLQDCSIKPCYRWSLRVTIDRGRELDVAMGDGDIWSRRARVAARLG